MTLDDLPIGTRCWAVDRGGDQPPVGGVVVGHLTQPDRVVVAYRWTSRPRKGKANPVPAVDVAVVAVTDIDPGTVEHLPGPDRVRLARAVAGVISARAATSRTPEDDRDLFTLAELMREPVPAGHSTVGFGDA